MATYFAPIGNGLGDLIVSLPAVQYLIDTGEPTILVLRSPRQEGFERLIPGLSGWVRESETDADTVRGAGHRWINLREHPLQTDHVWGSSAFDLSYPGYKIADIVRDICSDMGIHADFEDLTPLPFTYRAEVEGDVVLVPGSGGLFKCWLKQSWIALYDRLRSIGIRCHVLGQPESSPQVSELIEYGLPFLPTPTLKDALDVVSSARAMVSVDTGLMHLALQQLVPCAAIWINNPGSLNYMRTVKQCFPVVSPRCSTSCVSEELDKNLNLVTEFKQWQGYDSWMCHAQSKDRCMNNVCVDSVWRQTESALSMGQQMLACRV